MSASRPYYYPRSLFGPLLLAAIGVLLLLGNLGVITWHSMGWWFSQYWPVLIIIWGLVKLVEYVWARHYQVPAPGLGAGGVVLLVFLVLFGFSASRASRWDWGGMDWGGDFGDWDVFGQQHEFTQSFSQPVPPGAQVKILGTHGDIKITAGADDQAHLFVHKIVHANSESEADRQNQASQVKFEQQGALLVLDLVNGAFQSMRSDLELQLPRGTAVSVNTRHGDITVSDRDNDIDLNTEHGDITAENIKGNAAVRLRHGDASIKNVNGNVTVDGTVGDSTVTDVTGTLNFSGSYTGDVNLSRIAKQVHFSSTRTDLQLAKLEGDLTMDRSDFKANAVAGPFRMNTQYKDIQLEDVTGDVHIEDSRGDVEVHAKAPLGMMDISTNAGEINVSLPGNAGFQVDAQTNNSEIESDFPINVNNDSREATATGTVGKGGPQVRLRTNRKGIQIRKG